MVDTYTNSILGNTAYMLLNKEIGAESAAFAEEMYYHKSQGRNVMVKINSVGGGVLHAYNIIDAIIQTEADTYITGLAASMAGIVAQYGKKRYADSHASMMIHGIQGSGNKELKAILENNLRKHLTERSKMTPEDIDDIIDNKKEIFLDANKMLELGLVDEVVPNKFSAPKMTNNINELHLFYNKLEMNNDNEFKNLYEEGKAKIETLSNQLSETKTELKAKESELTGLKNQLDAVANERATELVNSFIEKGLIKEEAKEKWTNLAKADFTLAKETLSALIVESKDAHPSDFINKGSKVSYSNMADEELDKLAISNPELYNTLIMKK